jgi:ADP-heptose:LPS heptosyltransferase
MVSGSINPGKILVIVYGHIADTMAAIPGLRSLRAFYPSATVEVLALESAKPVLERCPYIDELITWRDFQHKGDRVAKVEKLALITALGWRLRRNGYDMTLVFHRSSGAIRRLTFVVGSPVRAGVSYGDDRYTHPVAPAVGVESSREENRRVLAAVGVHEDGRETELWTQKADSEWAAKFLEGLPAPRIGIHPGSDWSCQQWLPDRFAQVASRLQAATSAGVVITGSAGETELEAEITAGMSEPPVQGCGRTSFAQFVEVVRHLDLLICVNSAAAAVARVVGTPAVVLLGLEDARYTGVADTEVLKVIQPHAPTSGGWCEFGRWGVLSGCNSPMCRGLGGLARLEPDAVVGAALALLREGAFGGPHGGTAAQSTGTQPSVTSQVPIGKPAGRP